MEESEWKVELMACNRKAFKEKPLSELLSDVNYLTETDLSLMAACDSLAGTCSSLMRIHGGRCTSTSTRGLKKYQGGLTNSDVPKYSPRECGEGESSDEVVIEASDMIPWDHEQWDLVTSKPSHSSHFLEDTLSNFSRPADFERPATETNGKTTMVQGKEKKGKAIVHLGPSKTKHRHHTRAVPMSLSDRSSLPTKQKPTQVTSCMASRQTVEEGQGLVRRINASSELTSKLNDSMDILRQQLDRIFDSSLSLANSHKTTTTPVDASVHCALDREPTRDTGSTLTYLNLSDQGYCSDGSTLDGTRAAHLSSDGELLSPGSLDSAGGTPLSPLSPPKGSFSYSSLSRLGSIHSSNAGLYPEGIVKNSMSPRSAFKKVVRFSQ